tara:strand:- start:11 stop:433 length:423 start_codon:yes stop_codon:yes gene_type:complete
MKKEAIGAYIGIGFGFVLALSANASDLNNTNLVKSDSKTPELKNELSNENAETKKVTCKNSSKKPLPEKEKSSNNKAGIEKKKSKSSAEAVKNVGEKPKANRDYVRKYIKSLKDSKNYESTDCGTKPEVTKLGPGQIKGI